MKGLSIITAFVFSFFSFSCYGNADSHPQATLGEINEAPLKEIKQIIRRAYKAYKKGHPDLPKNYSVMAGYNIANDGSLSEIRLIKSSGSIMVDRTTAEILFNIGESRLFGIVSDQTSNSASLDVTKTSVKLQLIGFSPTRDEAKTKADKLSRFFAMMRISQRNPVVVELLRAYL